MSDAAYTAARGMIKDINNELQIVALIVVGVFAVIILWLLKVAGDGKKLVAEKEKAEIERTNHRTKERDAQINAMGARLDAEIEKVRTALEEHLKDHLKEETATQERFDKLDGRLNRIEGNMHTIDINIAKIMVAIELTGKGYGAHENVG